MQLPSLPLTGREGFSFEGQGPSEWQPSREHQTSNHRQTREIGKEGIVKLGIGIVAVLLALGAGHMTTETKLVNVPGPVQMVQLPAPTAETVNVLPDICFTALSNADLTIKDTLDFISAVGASDFTLADKLTTKSVDDYGIYLASRDQCKSMNLQGTN